MDQGMRFIQNHVTRFHRHIHSFALSIVYLKRPRFIHILGNVKNAGSYERVPVNVRIKNGSCKDFC